MVYKKVHKVKGREVHRMEGEVTRSDLTLNSTLDHVLANFPGDLLLHLVDLLVFHLIHLYIHHHLNNINHLPNNL